MQRHVVRFNNEEVIYQHKITDENFYLKAHSHNDYELIFFCEGDVSYTIENKKFQLNKFDLVITRPTAHHNLIINKKCVYNRYNALFSANGFFGEILSSIIKEADVINCADDHVIIEGFKKLDYYEENYTQEEFENLLLTILTEVLYKLKYKNVQAHVDYKPLPDVIKKAIEYINSNLFSIKDVSEISSALYVSKNYFFRVFKQELKISPKKYIVNKRLLHAQNLIRSGEKPTTVYIDCGFDNYTSFYKQYVEQFGYPPSRENKK